VKFRELEIDEVFQLSRDAEIDIGTARFQKQGERSAFLVDDLEIDPETEVEYSE